MNKIFHKPQIILVLGMHRSGTSLAAQIVSRWEAFMGDDLIAANEYNHEGYWEYKPLVILNDKMLAFTGNVWYAPPYSVKTETLLDTFGQEAKTLVEKMDESQKIWCWKDPRMAVLLPFWKKILADRKIMYVVTHRNPLSVADSLAKRDDIPTNVSISIWEFYTRSILSGIQKEEHIIFLEYEKMLSHPEEASRNLFNFLNKKTVEQKGQDVLKKMQEVIKPSLHHSKPLHETFHDPAQQELVSLLQQDNQLVSYTENKNRLKYCYDILDVFNKSDIFKEQNLRIQLFWSLQKNNFDEENSIKRKFDSENDKIEFELKDFNNHTFLRFDPLDEWAALSFNNLELFNQDELVGEVKYFESNAFKTINGNLFFLTRDPHLIFDCSDFSKTEITKVVFSIDYVLTGNKCKQFFADNPQLFFDDIFNNENTENYSIHSFNMLKSEIEKDKMYFNKQIQKLINNQSKLKETIALKENEKKTLQDTINAISSSKSWRITSPLRYVIRKTVVTKQFIKIPLKIGFYALTFNKKKLVNKLKQLNSIYVIKQSGQFDFNYYYKQYPDIRESKLNGIIHFVEKGVFEGRNPSSDFDTKYYLEQNKDVKAAKINPLIHYIIAGRIEGRLPIEAIG